MRLFARLILCVLACSVFAPAALAADKKPVRIVYVEWPCAVVTSYIAKVAIEERLGRPVDLLPTSAAVAFQALATGEAEASVSTWLPNTQKRYMEKIKGKVEDIGVIVGGARLGWVVPNYVPYTSIEELKGKAAEFGGKIYGIEPGAEYTATSAEAIKGYGLEGFELEEVGDAVMVAMLAEGIRKKVPVVVTGWAPHWKFGRWDLHFLDDPKGYFGTEEEIHSVVRNGLKDDMPEVYAFLKKFSYTDTQQLQKLMAENEEKGADPYKNAKKFVRDHKEQVDSWFTKE